MSHDPESLRLEVAREYPLMDRSAEAALADACRLATLLCGCERAAVEFVLKDSVWIAAGVGVQVGRRRRDEAPAPQFLESDRVQVVSDTDQDVRFEGVTADVGVAGPRFYAAVPLQAPEAVSLGVLSVWGSRPGSLSPGQVESLEALGRMVMVQLNLWRRQRQLERLEAQHAVVEAALRDAESKYRGIFENTVVGIYQTTPEGRYLSANPMLARIYGYSSPEELIGAVGDIEQQIYVDPGARDRFVDCLQRQEAITEFEARIRRKDGTIIWIVENARAVRDVEGKVQFYEGTVEDITDRKLAEDQLRNSEMLYHSLVEELPQNVFRKDRRERFIFANTRFCETVGCPIEKLMGRTDFDLYPPELARKYQEDDQHVMSEGRTVRATERNVTPDGAVRWVEVVKTPLRDIAGNVVGIQGIFWDVTEPKRLQDELAYERDLLQAFLDHSPDIIYFKDPSSRFVKVGRALAKRFNLADPETLMGKTSADLLPAERAKAVIAEEQHLLKTGVPIINQVEELEDHQGHKTWASVTKVPIFDRAGNTLGLVGVARDITQLIETEQALREAEEKFRTIFENSVEGIFQTSPEGRFIRVNPAFARIYGYSSPDELMASLTDVRTQVYVDPRRRAEFVQLVLDQGSITGFESEIYRRDGSVSWVSESARVVRDREGRLAYFEGTIEDISVRKQVDAEREKASRAALESARLKSEFVATVSHEIRTPLNAIVPNAERLLESRLDSQQRYLVESIDHGAHMLLHIVNDILDLSRAEAGAVALEKIDFDLHEVLERTISFFASRAHDKGLEWVGDIRPGVPRRVCGDPARLTQVLNNLAGNALKFTETGEVVMQVETVQAEADGVRVAIRMRDTGIGIAPESRERVFQAFAQADGSMSRRYGGTGLGLAISRKLVELMDGAIEFESAVGRGTTFVVTVRFAWPRHVDAEPPPAQVLVGCDVLVLEDNVSQGGVIASTLAHLGASRVVVERSLEVAAEMMRGWRAQDAEKTLVLYDTELPGVDAISAAKRLRAAGGDRLRIIALTVPGVIADARGLESAGIAGLLTKPLRQSRVASEIQQILHATQGSATAAGAVAPEVPLEIPARPGEGLQVLLVEDHPLNQRVASEMLDRLGARVDAVESGPQALEAVRRQRYDLVLMDCQMPDMDGYETTRRLREWERDAAGGGGIRIPVVALSANALTGDRERGLAAGMDDYLTKPLRQPEMARVLRRVATSRQASGDADVAADPSVPGRAGVNPPPGTAIATTASAESEMTVLDSEPLQALAVPGDDTVLRSFVEQYLADVPGRLARLRACASAGDLAVLKREAHTLKGSSSYMGARRVVAACAALEAKAAAGERDEVGGLIEQVAEQCEIAGIALTAYLRTAGRDL